MDGRAYAEITSLRVIQRNKSMWPVESVLSTPASKVATWQWSIIGKKFSVKFSIQEKKQVVHHHETSLKVTFSMSYAHTTKFLCFVILTPTSANRLLHHNFMQRVL